MAKNKVYTLRHDFTLNPGLSLPAGTFRLYSPRRYMNIKSITTGIYIYDLVTLSRITFNQPNNGQDFYVLIYGQAGGKIASAYNNLGGGFSGADNGNSFTISDPGQVRFDGFFVSELLLYGVAITNGSPNQCQYRFSIVTEVEEQIIYI